MSATPTPSEPIPAEVFLDPDEVPFSEDDLVRALTVAPLADLLTLDPDEIEQGEHLTDKAAEQAAALARVAGYEIRDEDHAEWAASIYVQRVQQVAAAARRRDDRIARIRAQYEEETRGAVDSAAFLGAALERYALARRAADEKRNKTTTLTSLRISTSTQNKGGKVAVTNEEALIEWAEQTLTPEQYETIVEHRPRVIANGVKALARIVRAAEAEFDSGHLVLVDKDGEAHTVPEGQIERFVVDDGFASTYVVGPDWLPVEWADILPETVSPKITVLG